MICRFCGAQLSETAIYCNKCGRQLRETPRKEPEPLRAQTENSAFSYDKPPEPVRPVTPTGRGADRSPYDERQKPQPVKKSGKGWIVVCAALCLLIASGLAAWRVWNALKPGLDNGGNQTVKGTEDEPKIDEPEDVPKKGEPKTEVPEKNEPSLPVQEDWSDYMETLPDYVTEENYEIEEKLFYSSCAMEYQDSTTTDSIDGWELYDTTTEHGESGSFGKWTTTKIAETDTCEVQKKQQYQYKIKETTSSDNSSLSGWTLDDKKESKTLSRDWGDTKITETATTKVETRTVSTTTYTLGHYCSKKYASSSEFGASKHHTLEVNSLNNFTKTSFKDEVFARTLEGYRNTSKSCANSHSIWFIEDKQSSFKTQYRSYRISTTYYFSKWVEQEWSDKKQDESDTCKLINTRTLYRSADRSSTTTYYFRRWSDNWSEWSDQPIAESDELQVKSRILYRYRSKP